MKDVNLGSGCGVGQPWVEKYRPRQVSQVAHQEEVVNTLEQALRSNNLPHLLFYGPPGTGKTSCALAIAHQLFGPLYNNRVMELNASDERGIGVVRNKIKGFASQAVGSGVPGFPCPPFKIIILDEADSMTEDAQSALRRTMELYTKVTRFVFICNYVSRIIDPIASRCAKFRFKPLAEEAMTDRINYICSQEGVELQSDVLPVLGLAAGGDMRKAITLLQSATRLYGVGAVSGAQVLHMSGALPPDEVQDLLEACLSNNFDRTARAVSNIVKQGYPATQVLLQLEGLVVESAVLSDWAKAVICSRMAEADKQLVDGADEHLQLLDVASAAMCAAVGSKQAGTWA
eukprot:CAMPEP_0196593792 /NCGR_PEP_ID=MMETSP1081-20130531/76582_1 /TAXON_ID=36882 /ORGANISM="Pyramimonas amylifera, Strain CCMP720" /LENGTH=344 /DNA_ID=CAMNT_0041917877 /DNA_START=192 /DNA_END=1226 /DNA_ORIENTATION=-